MRYFPAILAVVVAMPATLAGQRANSQKPTVAVLKVTGDVATHDSLSLARAIARGIQIDSLVDVVEGPANGDEVIRRDGQLTRPVRYIVTAVTSQVGSTQLVSLRVFNTETSTSVLRESTRAASAVLPDSLAAMGRRVARALSSATP